eukprot:m.3093 g.3093  ORF g.3093 m.3093 type:complete len:292 (+) comp2016_c0_seq1:288-1163(+)
MMMASEESLMDSFTDDDTTADVDHKQITELVTANDGQVVEMGSVTSHFQESLMFHAPVYDQWSYPNDDNQSSCTNFNTNNRFNNASHDSIVTSVTSVTRPQTSSTETRSLEHDSEPLTNRDMEMLAPFVVEVRAETFLETMLYFLLDFNTFIIAQGIEESVMEYESQGLNKDGVKGALKKQQAEYLHRFLTLPTPSEIFFIFKCLFPAFPLCARQSLEGVNSSFYTVVPPFFQTQEWNEEFSEDVRCRAKQLAQLAKVNGGTLDGHSASSNGRRRRRQRRHTATFKSQEIA